MWTADDIPDQTGRVAVVTGANGGLGFEVARVLARKGATVVVAARDQEKAHDAQRMIRAESPDATVRLYELDLASLDSVRTCGDRIAAEHRKIDLLVNNAGVMGIPERTTSDGFEMQLGVNHLGHFVLTRRLLHSILEAPAARVVSVTSFARLIGRPVQPDNPHLRGRYGPWRAYNQAKLANVQFAFELQRRLESAGASVLSLIAHPGLAHTDLQARSVAETGGGITQRFWQVAARSIGMSPPQGALPLLYAATDAEARAGQIYGPKWLTFGPPVRRPLVRRPRGGETLWTVSERETAEAFDVAEIVEQHS